jgi:hypothetical protein
MADDRKSPLEVAVIALERILKCNRGEEPDAEPAHSRIDRYAEEALAIARPALERKLANRRQVLARLELAPSEPPEPPEPPTEPSAA